MATFEVRVVQVTIQPHNNADALEIANIKGYQSIVRKGQFQTGDLAVYIPEQSIVPEWLLRRLNLWDDEKGKGKLAGSNGDRVKAVKLRGIVSQGLLYGLDYLYDGLVDLPYWGMTLEDDSILKVELSSEVSSDLGITKWEPPIPTQMAGEVCNLHGYTLKYDIENIKNHPEVVDYLIKNDVKVQITEKLHGTWACIGFYPETIHPEIFGNGNVVITSKGLSGKGLAFKNVPNNGSNLYVRAYRDIFADNLDGVGLDCLVGHPGEPVFFLGEIFGKGVQDLTYGFNEVQYRLFDIFVGGPRGIDGGRYLSPMEIENLTELFAKLPKLSNVPVLYEGPLTCEVIAEYTDGMDTLNGQNIREGIIIKPHDDPFLSFVEVGRPILKSVSEAYLLRKSGTEYN